jgi:hypothetical protein
MTMPQIVSLFKNRQFKTIYSAVNQQRFYGVLDLVHGVYSLTKAARVHYGLEAPEPVPAPVLPPCESSPSINAKYIPSLAARRPDALEPRDISYKNGSTDFRVGYRI